MMPSARITKHEEFSSGHELDAKCKDEDTNKCNQKSSIPNYTVNMIFF